MTWELEYKTRGEYVSALEAALADKEIQGADKMVTDIKNYFFKRNRQSIGDTEIIATLPAPEELAAQYEGKEYDNPRALKKNGSAGFFKRFGIFLLTVVAVVLGLIVSVAFFLIFLAGLLSVVSAVVFQMGWTSMLPAQVMTIVEKVPYQAFENNPVGSVFLVSAGIFLLLLSGTALKALRRLRKKYHTWTLKKISGCFRLPVTLDDVYSKAWRICVYIFLPLSMIAALVSMMMLIMGVDFTF